MAKNTSQIPNAYQTVFSKETKSARHQFEQADADYQKGLEAVAQMIENSKLDAKLKQMLQVQMKNLDSAKTSKQIESFIQQYSQEAKLGKRQLKYLDIMKSEIEKLREVESNRFKAELKYQGGSLSGLKEAFQRGGMKGAVGYGKAAMKSMSPGSMMKAGLHGVGVIADSPALNMLASSLKFDKDDRSYEASEEIRSILEGNSEAATESYSDTKRTSKATEKIADQNTEVVGELKRANQTLDEMLFRQKDMADDYKVTASRTESIATATQSTQKTTEEKKDSDWGMFGDLFGKKKGRLSKLLKGGAAAGIGSKALGLARGATPYLSKLGPIALAAGGAYGAYQGVGKAGDIFGTKDASIGQRIAAGLGGIANILSFGMADTGSTAKSTYNAFKKMGDWGKAGIGAISSMFESGGKGAGVISSGKGDFGGKSYGSHQMTLKTIPQFLKSSGYGGQFAGMRPGSREFDVKWRSLAKNDPNFGKAQENFIGASHYAPQAERLKKAGLDVSKRSKSLKSAVYSTSVQFGKDTGLIEKAMAEAKLDPKTATDKQIIQAIQGYKKRHNAELFRSSSAKVKAGTMQRAVDEEAILLASLAQEQIQPNAQKPTTPKMAIPSQKLNAKTEQAAVKQKNLPKKDMIQYDGIAAAVKAGMEGATVIAVSAPGKKSSNVPLEDGSSDSIRLSGIK